MSDEVTLRPVDAGEVELDDPILEELLQEEASRHAIGLESFGSGSGNGAPFDLRVMRPRAVDPRKYWGLTGEPEPATIAATLGPNTPVLLNHVVTPFAQPGKAPGGVWGLGYEFELTPPVDANTVSLMPSDEVLDIATIGQSVEVGLDVGGGVGVPEEALAILGARARDQSHRSVASSLDQPVVPDGAQHEDLPPEAGRRALKCTIKTWAKKAGIFGTRLFARKFRYDDVTFEIPLTGLTS